MHEGQDSGRSVMWNFLFPVSCGNYPLVLFFLCLVSGIVEGSCGCLYGGRAKKSDNVSVCHVLSNHGAAISASLHTCTCGMLVAGLAAALQYLLQNSYYSFTCMSILFMGLYMFAYVKTGTLLDLFKTLLNPAVLYITSGGWFMENSLELCFGGNEFVCLGACGIMVLLMISLGWWRYQHHDV